MAGKDFLTKDILTDFRDKTLKIKILYLNASYFVQKYNVTRDVTHKHTPHTHTLELHPPPKKKERFTLMEMFAIYNLKHLVFLAPNPAGRSEVDAVITGLKERSFGRRIV